MAGNLPSAGQRLRDLCWPGALAFGLIRPEPFLAPPVCPGLPAGPRLQFRRSAHRTRRW